MHYSAWTPNTACYYSISCVSSSCQFHFCNLLFTSAVWVLHFIYFLYFSASPSGNLPLLCLYPSLLVPKITFPHTLWCISCLLYSSLGLPSLILQLHLFQAPNISIYSLLYLFFPLLSRFGFYIPGSIIKQLHPHILKVPTRHRILVGLPQLAGKPHPGALTIPHNRIWRELRRQKQENESVKIKTV